MKQLVLLLCVLLSSLVFAQMPRTMSYQGLLTDGSGNFIPDGNHALTLKLYETASGGSAVYEESHSTAVIKGLFGVIIGSISPLPASLTFDKAYYLGVAVNGGAELVPRSALSAAPYALYAAVAGEARTLSSGANGIVTSVNNQSGAMTLQGEGSTTVNTNGSVITIASTGGTGGTGIQGVQSTDGSLTIASSTGPIADLRLANNSVTSAHINSTNASNGQVLTATGIGSAAWQTPVGVEFTLPYAGTTTDTSTAFSITKNGTNGSAVIFENTNDSNAAPTMIVRSNGMGKTAEFLSTRTNANVTGVQVIVSGSGRGINTVATTAEALAGTNRGSNTAAIVGRNDSSGIGVYGYSTKTGVGVLGQAGINGSTGTAGKFENVNTDNATPALIVTSNGRGGNALLVSNLANSGNIAIFQHSSSNKARIDISGKGYFNSGTQNSGADVAEAFAVVGGVETYEPGDVLVIATGYKRTVEKCSKPYAASVLGVHATRPGVLLTEHDIDADLSSLVPMGVVGVLPTKVTNEGGPISAGDMLVTSSTAGHAMKADPAKLGFGMVLGKALESFDGTTGVIQVFVNVK